MAGFSVEQEAAISICEDRKDAAVEAIVAHNLAAERIVRTLESSKAWWRFWR